MSRRVLVAGTGALLLASCLLSACTTGGTYPTLSQTSQTLLTIACAADKLAPTVVKTGTAIAQIANPAVVDQLAAANEADALAHPAVQAACDAALAGSAPKAVMPTLAPIGAPPGSVTVPTS